MVKRVYYWMKNDHMPFLLKLTKAGYIPGQINLANPQLYKTFLFVSNIKYKSNPDAWVLSEVL